MAFDPNKPYNDLPPLPPKANLETATVLKKCIGARAALAELKGAGRLLPNQSILINSIPLQEAKASSEIENIVTTEDDLFAAVATEGASADPQTKEVLRYRTALKGGFDLMSSRPLSSNLIVEVCSLLMDRAVEIRKIPGTQVANAATKETVYTPPEGASVIHDKLAGLERFIHADTDLDPLVCLALIHYQFEAIHPFHDGNGRTGRILNILYLVHKELLEIPVLYLSRYIIENKNDYYRLLRGVTEAGDWAPWVFYILDALEVTARDTHQKVLAIRDLFEATAERCRKALPGRVYSKELIELVFHQPYCKIKFLVDAGMCERKTASKYLSALEKEGVLSSTRSGKETVYLNENLIDVLRK